MRIAIPLAFALALAAVATAGADEFSDFRIPEHHVLAVDGSFSLMGSRFVSSEVPNAFRRSDVSALLGGNGFWWMDSDRSETRILARAVGFGLRHDETSNETEFLPGILNHFNSQNTGQEVVRSEGFSNLSTRQFPFAFPIGFQFGAGVSAKRGALWTKRNGIDGTQNGSISSTSWRGESSKDDDYRYDFNSNVGVGLGRVRDASGIYRARILERRIRDRGLLVHPLSSAAVQKVAALFYVEGDFSTVHDRPQKYFWRELERILTEDGALAPQGLDASTTLRLEEMVDVVAPLGISRVRGQFVGLRADAFHTHEIFRTLSHQVSVIQPDTFPQIRFDDTIGNSQDEETNIVYMGPEAEFHRPIGLRWQLDASAAVESAIPNDRVSRGLRFSAAGSVQWAISDRWEASVWVSEFRFYLEPAPGRPPHQDYWLVNDEIHVDYFIEDRLTLSLGCSERQLSGKHIFGSFSDDTYSERSSQILLELRYLFLGRHEAPGLFPPQSLSSGGMSR